MVNLRLLYLIFKINRLKAIRLLKNKKKILKVNKHRIAHLLMNRSWFCYKSTEGTSKSNFYVL